MARNRATFPLCDGKFPPRSNPPTRSWRHERDVQASNFVSAFPHAPPCAKTRDKRLAHHAQEKRRMKSLKKAEYVVAFERADIGAGASSEAEPRSSGPCSNLCGFYVVLGVAVVASIGFGTEVVSSVQAKRNLFELSLAGQVFGDICLPLDFKTGNTWAPLTSVNGGFNTPLDGKSTGLEQIFGSYSLSSLALLFASNARNLSIDPADSFENFERLQSMPEFDLEKRYSNGLWGQYYRTMQNCNGIFSSGYILLTSLLNATSSIMNREVETKENSIPPYIWAEEGHPPFKLQMPGNLQQQASHSAQLRKRVQRVPARPVQARVHRRIVQSASHPLRHRHPNQRYRVRLAHVGAERELGSATGVRF